MTADEIRARIAYRPARTEYQITGPWLASLLAKAAKRGEEKT